MKVLIDKSFEKDVFKIKEQSILNNIHKCILNTQEANSSEDIAGLKKLSGFKNEYRIRIRNYRLGLIIIDDTVEFIRCLHRKEIYRYFP